jgi:hypothetical protein
MSDSNGQCSPSNYVGAITVTSMDPLRRWGDLAKLDPAARRVQEILHQQLRLAGAPTGPVSSKTSAADWDALDDAYRRTEHLVGADAWTHYTNQLASFKRSYFARQANRR